MVNQCECVEGVRDSLGGCLVEEGLVPLYLAGLKIE